jgi:hypothetical protein
MRTNVNSLRSTVMAFERNHGIGRLNSICAAFSGRPSKHPFASRTHIFLFPEPFGWVFVRELVDCLACVHSVRWALSFICCSFVGYVIDYMQIFFWNYFKFKNIIYFF